MKSLIIGMGIGQLYKSVLTELGHEVVTVDYNPAVGADFQDYGIAFAAHDHFDTVHVCTPNYTHLNIARHAAIHRSGIVFVEKPGVADSELWRTMVKEFAGTTRFMMVKNNQWRSNIEEMKQRYNLASEVKIKWINKNRVPGPGSWFTTKELAFGGVSRDLLPHLLSLFMVLEPEYKTTNWLFRKTWQRWSLKDLSDTNYGTINPDGIYDVDDKVEFDGIIKSKKVFITADWRSNTEDDIAIYFDDYRIPLGLCPEEAYKNMIQEALSNKDNDKFWLDQLSHDIWIHKKINL
jgi:predicted dehydrogenase